jgi:hypothetical protein
MIDMQCATSASLADAMSLSGSFTTPADVFSVVQSTGSLGRREHRLASVLYEARTDASTELLRLSVAHPGDYCIWKSTTYVEPPRWGHPVIRVDGSVVLPGAGDANSPLN